MSDENVHKDHRKRVKKRFVENGLDQFDQHQVLELLLFYCIQRKDTNPIAHRLIERFDTVAGVLDAQPAQLRQVEGVDEGVITFLSLIRELTRYYEVSRTASVKVLNTVEECGDYLIPKYYGRRNETVYLLCLDAKCKVLCCKEVGEGSVNSAAIPIRRVVEMALAANATSVILSHNHPSGVAFPSHEDVATTCRLAKALNAVEIALVDHIVVADDDYVSMVQSGMYRPEDCYI